MGGYGLSGPTSFAPLIYKVRGTGVEEDMLICKVFEGMI